MQSGVRQRGCQGQQILKRGTALKVVAGTAAVAKAQGADTGIMQPIQRWQVARSGDDDAA